MTEYISIKPKRIQAIQWTGDNADECREFCTGQVFSPPSPDKKPDATIWVAANNVRLPLELTEWIIRDSLGVYPCKDHVFRETYRPMINPSSQSADVVKQITDSGLLISPIDGWPASTEQDETTPLEPDYFLKGGDRAEPTEIIPCAPGQHLWRRMTPSEMEHSRNTSVCVKCWTGKH